MSFDLICFTLCEVLVCVQVTPTAEEAGHCDVVEVTEIGDTNIVIFKQGEYQKLIAIVTTGFETYHKISMLP